MTPEPALTGSPRMCAAWRSTRLLAATTPSLPAGEELDAALRRAFWRDSRSISHRRAILDVADEVATGTPDAGLDPAALADARQRRQLMDDYRLASTDLIPGSPTVVLPDGTVHWEGPWAAGYPVVDHYEPGVYLDLITRAALVQDPG
jgi:2-hydroxychromene-2-carboxylate isomerase